MLRLRWMAGVGAASMLFLCGNAAGHGGQYLGPGDLVPPNLGGGGDNSPPGGGTAPGTGAPKMPTTGGRAGGPTTGGLGAPGRGGMRAGGSATGGVRKRLTGGGYDQWQFWWEHNKAPFLRLREHLGGSSVVTGSVGLFLGRYSQQVETSVRPGLDQVRDIILPVLLPMLDESDADQVDSAALALARMVPSDHAELVLEPLIRTLGHDATSAREAATLALGVLGSRDAVPVLRDLLLDTLRGRQLTRHAAGVEDRIRAFAAASLGLIGDATAVPDLMQVVGDARLQSQTDLKAMAVTALGLVPGQDEAIVPFLLDVMKDRSQARLVRAQAPIALGKRAMLNQDLSSSLLGTSTARMVQAFQDDKSDDQLRRSLANGLGMVGSMADPEVVGALTDAVARASDDQTRFFSLMALAQIGARDEYPGDHAQAHEALENLFLTELVRPRRSTHQPYAALGLGVYARNEAMSGLRSRSADKLLESLRDTNNPSHQGAMAVALGLLNARKAQEDLVERFRDSRDADLRGYLALSLGMMKAQDMQEEFRAMIRQSGLAFRLRLQLARALGLLGDPDAVPALVAYLQHSETLSESSAAAQALGLVGDRRAIDPLVEVVTDEGRTELQRAFGAVALGILAEKSKLPWNAVFSVHANYRAKVPALAEILDIL